MLRINPTPGLYGSHSGRIFQETVPARYAHWLEVPPELEEEAMSYLPFIILTIKKGAITGVAQGQRPEPVKPEPLSLDVLRKNKLEEISNSARSVIISGCGVTLSDGSVEHFSLTETDQINLTTAFGAVAQGAVGYPYHADGQLCRLYPAADIMAIGAAVTAHKLYHTTYCNHLNVWVRRVDTSEELEGIQYGVELPEDLANNMAEVLQYAQAM